MTAAEISAFLNEVFPQVAPRLSVEEVGATSARVTMRSDSIDLRPGGTVSGPTLFKLADVAFYVAVLAAIGPKALAVTTSAQIDFMRKPAPGLLRGEARLLKVGRVLVVGDVLLYASGADPVARASMTYSVPPARG